MIIRCLILIFLTPAALPSDSADHCWSFIITGDSRGADNGVNSVILAELADEIVNSGVDIFLFSGDLITGAVDDPAAQLYNWLTIMQPVYNAGIPVYVDLNDLAILAADWLRCGNPFDPACAE